MGPEALIFFVLGMIAPLTLLAMVAFWWRTAESRRDLEGVWEGYARRRGLTFVRATGDWPNRTAPAVRWADGDADYVLEARGAETLESTQVAARPAVAVCGSFTLRPNAAGDAGDVTGDPLIDARFRVESRPERLAKDVLTPEVTRALLGFDVGRAGSLRYDRGDVQLVWGGAEASDARLDEAREVVRKVVGALRATARPD